MYRVILVREKRRVRHARYGTLYLVANPGSIKCTGKRGGGLSASTEPRIIREESDQSQQCSGDNPCKNVRVAPGGN